MSRKAKQLVTDEYGRLYDGVDSVCVVDLTGLDAISTHRLRGKFREKGIELRVVRNALARRAFESGPLDAIGRALDGPCALVTGGASIIDVAKDLVGVVGEMPQITLKFAMLDGDPELLPVEQVAKMKSQSELHGEILMLLLSPWRRVASQITSPWARVAGCVKAVAEKAEQNQAA
jgi:large subunit ribosomal protein L10